MIGLLAIQEWQGEGHAVHGEWLEIAGRLGGWMLLALVVVLVLRGFLRSGRYRAVGVLSESDVEAVHAAIRDAERRTVGEILPVVLERSDRHPAANWLAAIAAALCGSVLLVGMIPWERPLSVLVLQVGLGTLGYGLARFLPDFRRLFISPARARETSEEQAFQEFYGHRLNETEGRTGVLIFVSLLEHRVVVLADEGIASEVDAERWVAVDGVVLEGIRRGSLRDGLVAGIEAAGGLLAEFFPCAGGDRNELPDRVIVRRE